MIISGKTLILHDPGQRARLQSGDFTNIDFGLPNEIHHCKTKDCYSLSVQYPGVTPELIQYVLKISERCYQEVKFECYISKLTHYASWTDIHGNSHDYFSRSDRNECQCSKNESCFNAHVVNINKCNCDIGDPTMREDIIRITNKVNISR